jgi:TPR repeat protein
MKRALVAALCVCFSLSLAHAADNAYIVPLDQKRFDQGAAAFDAGDYQTAYAIFSELAKKGDIAAMRNVALMERKGIGTKRDLKDARELYGIAAESGLPTAQYDLAQMLINGEGGAPDPKGALLLLQAASEGNHALAQYQLGLFYEQGQYVPRDVARAESLYAVAAEHGVWDAKVRLAALKGWPAPVPPPPAAGLQPAEPISPH